MYKNLFFDLDDTLWAFSENAYDTFLEMYEKHRYSRFFHSFSHFYGLYQQRNSELWVEYAEGKVTKDELNRQRFFYPLQAVGVEDALLAKQFSEDFFAVIPTKSKLMPHAGEVLDYLHGRYTLSIVSNGFVEVQYRKIRNSGIAGYFDHIVLSEEAGALKPDKRIFEHALRLNDARPDETLMVGDLYQADIAGAQNASIDQAYFNWRGTPLPPANAPTYTIRSLRELMEIL